MGIKHRSFYGKSWLAVQKFWVDQGILAGVEKKATPFHLLIFGRLLGAHLVEITHRQVGKIWCWYTCSPTKHESCPAKCDVSTRQKRPHIAKNNYAPPASVPSLQC